MLLQKSLLASYRVSLRGCVEDEVLYEEAIRLISPMGYLMQLKNNISLAYNMKHHDISAR